MVAEVHVRKLAKSWQFDFKMAGHPRQRKGGFRSKSEAIIAGRKCQEKLLAGAEQVLFGDAYKQYMSATDLRARSRERYGELWERIEPELGHLYIEEVDTPAMDQFKATLRKNQDPNHHLALIKAVLRFMWKRGKLKYVPYVPMAKRRKKEKGWYSQQERDLLLDGMFQSCPQWYAFFYLTCRLGLRRGEVYAISHTQVLWNQQQIVINQQVQQGFKQRPAVLVDTRKNGEAYTLDVTDDVLDAIRWHMEQGYAGDEFLFSKDGAFPKYLDSYKGALSRMQKRLGLRPLLHHAIGRHSVASQAASGGESIKSIQAQLGHCSEQSTLKYMHLANKGQLRLIEGLKPASPPHESGSNNARVNEMSTKHCVAMGGKR